MAFGEGLLNTDSGSLDFVGEGEDLADRSWAWMIALSRPVSASRILSCSACFEETSLSLTFSTSRSNELVLSWIWRLSFSVFNRATSVVLLLPLLICNRCCKSDSLAASWSIRCCKSCSWAASKLSFFKMSECLTSKALSLSSIFRLLWWRFATFKLLFAPLISCHPLESNPTASASLKYHVKTRAFLACLGLAWTTLLFE